MPFPLGLREVGTLLLGLLLCCAAAQGGERRYYFDSLGSDHGLTSHTVTALLQDRTGYIWIATQDGVHQYDGYRYRPFYHVPDDATSLPESFVTALAQDDAGRIWVGGAAHGLSALDPASGKVAARSEVGAGRPDPRDAIGALLFDSMQGLWIGTSAGIEIMDVSSRQRREIFHFPVGSDAARIFQLQRALDGTVWAASSIGLLHFTAPGAAAQLVATRELPAAFSVFAAADGSVFVGGGDGVYRIDAQHDGAQRLWPNAGTASAPVRAIAQDNAGRLWLSPFGTGLVHYDPATHTAMPLLRDRRIPGSLPDDYVSQLLLDHSGLLWIGTQISGVAACDPEGAQFRLLMDTAPERNQMANMVRAIAEDGSGRLWLGTEGDGLKRYDPAHDSFE